MRIMRATAVIVILLLVILEGCSSIEHVEDGKQLVDAGFDLASGMEGSSEKYFYTMCIPHGDRINEDERYQLLIRMFNVDFEFISVAETDWNQRIKAWVAAGDLPDITTWDVDYSLYNQYRDYAKKGIIKAIPELAINFPNLQKIRDEMFSDDVFEINGKLYIWLSYADTAKYNNLSDEMFFYRRDWAKKLGIEKGEYTWNEVLEMAKVFIMADPGGNGNGMTVGMGCDSNAFPDVMGMRFINPYWDRYYLKDKKFVWGPSQPETLHAVKIASMMYQDRLFWKGQPFANLKDAENRFVEGKMGMYWTDWSVERINEIRNKMVRVNPELDVHDIAPLIIKKDDGRVFMQRGADFRLGTFFNASLSDKKLERILKMWDWLAGEEGMQYMSMGIKGRDWDFKDGKPVLYWDRMEDGTITDPYAGKYGQWFWRVVRLDKSFYYDYPYYPEHAVKTAREIQRYKLKPQSMAEIKELDLISPVLDSPLLRQQGSMDMDPHSHLVKVILESDDAEAEWKAWIDAQKPTVEKTLYEYESLYKLHKNH